MLRVNRCKVSCNSGIGSLASWSGLLVANFLYSYVLEQKCPMGGCADAHTNKRVGILCEKKLFFLFG